MIVYKNNITGEIRNVPEGFSWTTLFFGFFPALFRADYQYAAIQIMLALVTFGISTLIFPFIYNSLYMKKLISLGFEPFK